MKIGNRLNSNKFDLLYTDGSSLDVVGVLLSLGIIWLVVALLTFVYVAYL